MKKKLKKIINSAALAYLSVSSAVYAADWIKEIRHNNKCRANELGNKRLDMEDVKRFRIYSDEETLEQPCLKDVELVYFPNPSGERKDYILYLPGGAYLKCFVEEVAAPAAAIANEHGYPVFVLKYRVKKFSERYAPIEDLARAISFINANVENLNVNIENYMLNGFSAGGNLAGLFASKSLGYEKYGLNRPACLTLVYPWLNINSPIKLSWNPFRCGFLLLGKRLAIKLMLGRRPSIADKSKICVQNLVDGDYPDCYLVHGDKDRLVPKELNSDVFVDALKQHGIEAEYRICPGLSHGFGIGVGTSAEGWLEESFKFWEKHKR